MHTTFVDDALGTSRPNHDTLPGSVMEKAMVLNREEEQGAQSINKAPWHTCYVAALYVRRESSGFCMFRGNEMLPLSLDHPLL